MLILFNYLIHSIKNNNIKLIQRQLIPSFLQFHFNANEIDWKDGGGAYAAAAVAFTSSTFFSIQLIPLQQPAIAHIWWNNVIITVWLYHCTVIIQFNSFKLFMNQIEILSFLLGRKNDWFDEWKESCSLHWKSRFSNYAIIGYEFLPQLSLNKSIPSFFL